MKTLMAGCCAVLFLSVAGIGCSDSKCADGSCGDTSTDFTLRTCIADSDCGAGSACLPEKCDGTCAPDPDGRCQPCPAEGSGLCMPTSTGGGTTPAMPACFAGRLGDPAACGIDADWGRKAVDTCAAQGAELIDLHALLTCPDGRPSGVVFTCCAFDGTTPVDPPPPPEDCPRLLVMVDPANSDPAFVDPKMEAFEQCRAMGLELRDLQPMAPDASGQSPEWIATCCGPVVQPPPNPGTCQEIPIPGDPSIDPKEMAYRMCLDQNLALQDLKPLDMDSAGNVFTWIAVCCGGDVPPEPPPPPPPETCTVVPVKADPSNPDPMFADPKMAAYQQCEAMGLVLQDLRPDAPDAAGNVYLWWASCCGPDVQPPDPGTCLEIPFPGDPNVDPKAMADRLCVESNLALTEVKPLDMDAAGNVFTWIAVCCGPVVEPPPPTPDVCTTIPIGDGTCGTNVDFKMMAWEQCSRLNLVLQDLAIRNTCDDGSIGAVVATCCP